MSAAVLLLLAVAGPGAPASAADGGTDSIGASQLATTWYFAEGTTRADFDCYLAIMNPNQKEANLTITYMLSKGEPVTRAHTVEAGSRYTINLRKEVGEGQDVSASVSSDLPVMAERPVYFNYAGKWAGGTDSIGASQLATTWYFAEGTTRANFDCYLAIMNPNQKEANLTITYMLSKGEPVTRAHTVEAGSRYTINLRKEVGEGQDVSASVSSDLPVMAERPVYFGDMSTGGGQVVCVDPGHQRHPDLATEPIGPGSTTVKEKDGGGTSGVVTKVPEWQVNLQVSLELRDLLEAAGVTVVMTHTTPDVDLGNVDRAVIANNAGADLFVRVHCDGIGNPSTMGTSTLYPALNQWTGPISAPGLEAARLVQRELLAHCGRPDRGVVGRGDLTGFNWSKVPAILVEVAFMSNPTEDTLLSDPEFQRKAARGMFEGIMQFLESR